MGTSEPVEEEKEKHHPIVEGFFKVCRFVKHVFRDIVLRTYLKTLDMLAVILIRAGIGFVRSYI